MSKLLLDKEFFEHSENEDISAFTDALDTSIFFQGHAEKICVAIDQIDGRRTLSTSYYVGCGWLSRGKAAVLVSPKLDRKNVKINYLSMMFSCLKHPWVIDHTDSLYEVRFDEESIELRQDNDLLTPLLVTQFLQMLRHIVKKGLKQSYYRVEKNLQGRIKGKVLIGKTVKENLAKNKPASTMCSFDSFGVDCVENRILKKALRFCEHYLSQFPGYKEIVSKTLSFIRPAFDHVSDEANVNDLKWIKQNTFYKEYTSALRVAGIILKRFAYNIKNTESVGVISSPPFWIDMSKLFELYVLGILSDRFGNAVKYHFSTGYNELDFLLNKENEKIIIDTKYRPLYKNTYDIKDIRQLSGYARLKEVHRQLGAVEPSDLGAIDCLIIYPDQDAPDNLDGELRSQSIDRFVNFYKRGIRLPVIQ